MAGRHEERARLASGADDSADYLILMFEHRSSAALDVWFVQCPDEPGLRDTDRRDIGQDTYLASKAEPAWMRHALAVYEQEIGPYRE